MEVSITIGDISLKLDVIMENLAKLIHQVRLASEIKPNVILTNMPEEPKFTVTETKSRQRSVRLRGFNPPHWELIGQVHGELRGRDTKNTYWLYESQADHQLVGVIKNPRGSVVGKVILGRMDDPNSRIAEMVKFAASMPVDKSFTRNELIHVLPSRLSYGNVLKFSMYYLVESGKLKKLKERDIATGAIKYVRNNVIGGSSEQSGEEVARATVGLQ